MIDIVFWVKEVADMEPVMGPLSYSTGPSRHPPLPNLSVNPGQKDQRDQGVTYTPTAYPVMLLQVSVKTPIMFA